jgi:hypothetical protein
MAGRSSGNLEELFSPSEGLVCEHQDMDTFATTDPGPQPRPVVSQGRVKDPQQTVYVIATRIYATSHALDVAGALAREQGRSITVLVSAPQRFTITSARAGAYNLPVQFPEVSGMVTAEAVRHMVAGEHRLADVVVTEARDAHGFAHVLPPSATVILAGPIHHFVETQEQRLTRKLSTMGFDVIFLPCPDQ